MDKLVSKHKEYDSLDKIGLKYGTDKSSVHHNYLEFYENYFPD